MNTKDYIENVLKTESNDFDKIGMRFADVEIERLTHAGMGMVTESAEFIDVLKKAVFYGRDIDIINLKEELGDLCWYIAIALDVMGEVSFEGIMEINIAKLKARYGDRFGETQAENRDLVKEREVLEDSLAKNMFEIMQPRSIVRIIGLVDKEHEVLEERVLPIPHPQCKNCKFEINQNTAPIISPNCPIHGVGIEGCNCENGGFDRHCKIHGDGETKRELNPDYQETVQFKGESSYDAIINHYSLDIEEQSSFDNYLINRDVPQSSDLKTLREMYDEWIANYDKN